MNKYKAYRKTIFFVSIFFFFIATSCTEENEKEQTKNFKGEAEIQFHKTEHDFGVLREGEIAECTFRFKNTGKSPLNIVSVTADCGCTVPEFSTEAVLPGEEGKITVVFNSTGFRNNIYKTIDVETNAKQSYIELVLTAFIENNNNLN